MKEERNLVWNSAFIMQTNEENRILVIQEAIGNYTSNCKPTYCWLEEKQMGEAIYIYIQRDKTYTSTQGYSYQCVYMYISILQFMIWRVRLQVYVWDMFLFTIVCEILSALNALLK